ncbi:spindle assembly checkpoint component Mad1 [Lipomyces japonicus]|uniref:spindle assembly checkpoint component Mad1 n=1 Tax=Lipomyces japonicus TaxID=56871 RepID=UPI0034CFCE93
MRKSITTPLHSSTGLAGGGSSIPIPRRSSFTPLSLHAPKPVTRALFPPQTSTDGVAEIDTLRAENHALKYDISALRDEREREKLRFEQNVRELEQKINEEGQRADALEKDQQYLFDKHREAAEELNKVKEQSVQQKTDSDKTTRSLRLELQDALEKKVEAESNSRSLRSRSQRVTDEFALKNKTLSTTVSELTAQLDSVNSTSHDRLLKLNEQSELVEKLTAENKTLKEKAEDLAGLENIERQLSEQIAHSKSLENQLHIVTPELNQLRQDHKKFKFVSEEKTLLEARLKLMEDLRRQVADAELEAATLREANLRWIKFLESDDNFNTPEDVVRALAQERTERVALLDKVGRLEAELAARSHGLQQDEKDIQQFEQRINELQNELNTSNKLLARVERQKNLALKESDFLRDQLKTYDSEETMFMQGNYDQQKANRIEQLESLHENLKSEILKLTSELKEAEKLGKTSINIKKRKQEPQQEVADEERIGELLRRNRKLQDDHTALIKKEESTRKEIAGLEKQIATLESSKTAQTRVLELRDNPASRDQLVKKQLLEVLKQENNSLLAQLEQRRDDIGQVVSISSLDRLRLEIKEMEVEVSEKEKRMKRLKEIWSAKSTEFREAVYSLLGYKLDFLPNNKVRATSMFASNDEESFTFDPEAGTMKHSGKENSPFERECSNLITFWIKERREIPCFLAALNLELYDRTTKAARF